MRDRGITKPGMKAAIAAALAVCGAVAAIWGARHSGVAPGEGSPATLARNLGVVLSVAATLATLNYLYALALVRRMRRGEGVIARWTVGPPEFARFRDRERARTKRKNNWRVPRKGLPDGLTVIFSADAVLAGDTYFKLSSGGISRFTYARIEHDIVPSVEFSMTLTVIGAGPQPRTARYRGHLRVPIADDAGVQAARVVGHFQEMISD